ncbi:MAG TPA: formate--tetrahydrofolate ligase, partial [Acidocella sp.]|nr:formate--tetrahydrofolate ligase [Acidocella sp.]
MSKTIDPTSDIAIAQAVRLQPIQEIAGSLGIPADALFRYGPFKGKISLGFARQAMEAHSGKLILVTAISPTPAGEGKT